jgi:hypothetical protein
MSNVMKGLASMQSLSRDTRSLWRETAQSLELACGWQPMTPKPDALADLTPSAIEKLRATDDANSHRLLVAWNQWAVARSFQIADNIGRMRGLLCLLRYWRRVQRADPDDIEAAQGVLTVWEFAKTHWGIQTPPEDSRLWPAYCEHHVIAMARRKERSR